MLHVGCQPCAVAAVSVEVARRPMLERRVIGRRVAEAVVRRGELLLAASIGCDAPRVFLARWRVEKKRVVSPALSREEDCRLDRPSICHAYRVIAIQRQDEAVTKTLVGVEIE